MIGLVEDESQIESIDLFFQDVFYIKVFEALFPQVDFSKFEPAEEDDLEGQADNMEQLIGLLEEMVEGVDLSRISGDEIVQGEALHVIGFLQVLL